MKTNWMLKGLFALVALAGFGATPVVAQTVEYVHTDALGSVVAITDAAGNVIERNEYEPYGSDLTGAKDGPGYTGHVSDAATGLSYMQQRYYDPQIGRFLSVDPVTANSGTGANFNRYWYANNNPYRFTDPDGRLAGDDEARRQGREAAGATEDKTIAGALMERTADKLANVETWKDAGAELANDVGEGISDVFNTAGDIAQCAAQCAVQEVIGATPLEAVGKLHEKAVEKAIDDGLADSPSRSRWEAVKEGKGLIDAVSTVVCTVGCAEKSNDSQYERTKDVPKP